jgi:hypothetical protein
MEVLPLTISTAALSTNLQSEIIKTKNEQKANLDEYIDHRLNMLEEKVI